MTAGYFDETYMIDLLTKNLLNNPNVSVPTDVRRKFEQALAERNSDYFRRTICRLGRLVAVDMAALAASIVSAAKEKEIPQEHVFSNSVTVPLFLLGCDFKKLMRPWSKNKTDDGSIKDTDVVVFANTRTSYQPYASRSMLCVTPFSYFFEHFDGMWAAYKADLSDQTKSKKWATPKRTRKTLWKPTVMSLSKFITSYTELPKKYPSNVIRDIADVIEESRRPIEVLFADKAEDFVKMYATGPSSCMSVQNNTGEIRRWNFLVQAGSHPAAFYAGPEYIRGAYVLRKDKILARTLLYKQKDGSWKYGRVYPPDAMTRTRFETALQRLGYTVLEGVGHGGPAQVWVTPDDEFEIPGVQMPKSEIYALPYPYFDNIAHGFKVFWNKDTKKFHVVSARNSDAKYKDWYVAPHAFTGGFITSSQCGILKCKSCGTVHKSDILGPNGEHAQVYMHSETGEFACCQTCQEAVGWVTASRSDGSRILVNKVDAIPDKYNYGQYFTNEQAAIRVGAYPVIEAGPFVMPEEYEYSTTRYHVANVLGENFSVQAGAMDSVKKLKQPPIFKIDRINRFTEIDVAAHIPIVMDKMSPENLEKVNKLLQECVDLTPIGADGELSEEWLSRMFESEGVTETNVRDQNGNNIQVTFSR